MTTRSHLTRPRPRQVVVHLGDGDDITITYDSNRLKPSWLEQASERDKENNPRSIAVALSEVMLGWDVTEDDGSEFPPTADNLAELSFPVMQTLMEKLVTSANEATRAEGEGSSATSSTPSTDLAEKPSATASLQNGPAPSESLKPSESVSST